MIGFEAQKNKAGGIRHIKAKGVMRQASTSILSATSPHDDNKTPRSQTLKLKAENNVPDSFLVPMILRKTKIKQK